MKKIAKFMLETLVIILGAVIAGLSLELFLVPNQILDGGIVGISIILYHLTDVGVSLYLILLNIPFLLLALKHLGRKTAVKFSIGVIGLSATTFFLHHSEPITEDLLLATVFGGLMLGAGIGIAMKLGGALDGSEIFSLYINAKTGRSTAQILLLINVVIFGTAGFIFGWEQAMYSVIAFYIAFKVIDIVLEGLDETKNVWIISDKSEEISRALMDELGKGVTFFKGEGAFTNDEKRIIFSVITRIEENQVKEVVHRIDPHAFMTFSHIAEVSGRHFKKSKH